MAAGLWVEPGPHIREDLRAARDLLHPGDTFVDVGANIGLFTLVAASKVGGSGRVISIEPHPTIFQYLKENIARNDFEQIVQPRNVAVAGITGTLNLTDLRNDDANKVAAGGPISVAAVTLDALLQEFEGPVDLLKIDVEGYEPEVLAGATITLERTKALLVESSDATVADIAQILEREFDLTLLNHNMKNGVRNFLATRRQARNT